MIYGIYAEGGGHYDTLGNLFIRKSVYIHTPGCQALV